MSDVSNLSMTDRTDKNRSRTSLNESDGLLGHSTSCITVGAILGPHAVISKVEGRWLLLLVGCHRELEVSFRYLLDALNTAKTLVETAVQTAALSYTADPYLLEASA